jgi:4-carboxymuconolactone decarboxylase
MSGDDRYERGLARLREMHGKAGEDALAALDDLAPDLHRHVVEYAFGDIYDRPGLDLKTRQLVTVAALVAMANAQPQLTVHFRTAMRLGWSKEALVEVILQLAAYAGFPAAMNAVAALKAAIAMAED